jgi:twinkle protein
LERNGQADCPVERNTTKVRVIKNRFSGVTGLCSTLFYDASTGRLNEVSSENIVTNHVNNVKDNELM